MQATGDINGIPTAPQGGVPQQPMPQAVNPQGGQI
jgi:hypothetical protein